MLYEAIRNASPSDFLVNLAPVKHEAYRSLVARARGTVEPQPRLALYRRADRLLVQEALL